jgi:hypothetical protein
MQNLHLKTISGRMQKTNIRGSQLKNTISHETFPIKEKRVRNYFFNRLQGVKNDTGPGQ